MEKTIPKPQNSSLYAVSFLKYFVPVFEDSGEQELRLWIFIARLLGFKSLYARGWVTASYTSLYHSFLVNKMGMIIMLHHSYYVN